MNANKLSIRLYTFRFDRSLLEIEKQTNPNFRESENIPVQQSRMGTFKCHRCGQNVILKSTPPLHHRRVSDSVKPELLTFQMPI